MEPSVIRKISDEKGETVYEGKPRSIGRLCRAETCDALREMMEETVLSGTGRKAFGRAGRDPVLKDLVIGGKTGSINSEDQELHYDWFVGFAREKNGGRTLAFASVVAHEKVRGRRASAYAQIAMRHYFR
jgi:membrane peptidoglycan carboxypeptidase